MIKVFALILSAVMMLPSAACTRTSGSNAIQNVPSASLAVQPTEPASESISAPQSTDKPSAEEGDESSTATKISITVNGSVFSAQLYDNEATKAFLAKLPMTLNMADMNGNEKYYNFSENLSAESTEKPEVMNAGDIMCWSGNCLVLFYKTFPNSYGGYIRLGYVEDVSGLASALGSGDAQIEFAVSD